VPNIADRQLSVCENKLHAVSLVDVCIWHVSETVKPRLHDTTGC